MDSIPPSGKATLPRALTLTQSQHSLLLASSSIVHQRGPSEDGYHSSHRFGQARPFAHSTYGRLKLMATRLSGLVVEVIRRSLTSAASRRPDSQRRNQESLAASFGRWLTEFDPDCDHILCGSDWIMLGKEAGYNHSIESINAFLRTECRLPDDACDKIFRRNALRFLPLAHGNRGRNCLLAYYRRNGLDESRLPSGSPRLLLGLLVR